MGLVYQLFLSWIVPLVLHLKYLCHTQSHLCFLLCYLLKVLCFCVLHQVCNHFGLMFVEDVRSVSRLIFLNVHVQLFQHYLLKRFFSLHGIFFSLSLTILMRINFWALFCSIDISIPSAIPYCLNYCSFIVSLAVSTQISIFLKYRVHSFSSGSFASPL